MDQARKAVREGKTTVAVVIPKDFGAAASRAFFRPETKPEIALLYDPSHATEMSMIQGILAGAVMQAVSKEAFGGQTGRQTIRESLAEIKAAPSMSPDEKKSLRDMLHGIDQWSAFSEVHKSAGQQPLTQGLSIPFQVRSEAITSGENVPYNGYAHSFAGMGVQFILFVGIDVGMSLLVMRQRGVWKRLRAAPLSRGTLLAAGSERGHHVAPRLPRNFRLCAGGIRSEGFGAAWRDSWGCALRFR